MFVLAKPRMNPALKILIVAGLFIASSSFSTAQTKDSDTSVEVLRHAHEVDDIAVGAAATRTQVYKAFSELYLAGKKSSESAKDLVETGSPAGRFYGYLILRHVSPHAAEALTPRLLQDRSSVTVFQGCVGSDSTVAQLVERIQKGQIVIAPPDRRYDSTITQRKVSVHPAKDQKGAESVSK
jgi:hypothetical protein